MTSDLILGIIGGIIATSITVAISYFFKTIAIPFLKSALFDIPDISGKWCTHDAEDQEPIGTAIIKQYSRQIEIKTTRNINRDGKKTDTNFLYKGKFASGTLVASYEDINLKGYIMGSVVMRLLPDNKTLFGKTVYFDHNKGQIVVYDYWLKR